MRVVLEVVLIAMARKVIIEEPNTVPSLILFGIAALILALGIAFFFERQALLINKFKSWRAQFNIEPTWWVHF